MQIHALSVTGSMIAFKLSRLFLRDLAFSIAPERIQRHDRPLHKRKLACPGLLC